MENLDLLTSTKNCSLYKINQIGVETEVLSLLASTPETRAIVNDPLICGIKYTDTLRDACAQILKSLPNVIPPSISNTINESNTSVLNILRGGLNFGLREALGKAYSWNNHSAAFISAQRVRDSKNTEEWYITESNYQKVYLPDNPAIIFGDVVATGTSLEFALNEILEIAQKTNHPIASFIFFTIGGPRSTEILESISKKAKKIFPEFAGSVVVYLEGCFSVASPESSLSIKITGTDLIRRESILAPEFIASQLECPSYPIERCTIYDAGSRAFWLQEYFQDILEYWELTKKLGEDGLTYTELLSERFPEFKEFADKEKKMLLSDINLVKICENQISKIQNLIGVS